MDNNTISLQELLDSISRLREDVNTLPSPSHIWHSQFQGNRCNQRWHQSSLNHAIPNGLRNNKTLSGGLLYYWMKNMLVKITISADSSENP
ncbi:ybl58 [Escherichia coli]|nr:ybl58 [Escherichia coli]